MLSCTFSLIRGGQTFFPECLYQFVSPPAGHGWSGFSLSSPALGAAIIFNFYHSGTCTVITPCGFNLYFHNGSLCWTFFPMLICHQCIPFSEISFHIFYPFSNWIICFLLLNWILRVLYVVEILVLCWIFTLWTFSPSLWVCLFIFLA